MTVSVLTPTITGRGWFLDRCRRSVATQSYPHEHVIVNRDALKKELEAIHALYPKAEKVLAGIVA